MADLGMSRHGIKSILRIVQTGEAVGTDQAQTFLQLQTFQLGLASNDNIVLDNDKKLQGKSTGGTPLQIARITNADTLSVGESSVITQTNIFAGSVTACISIANSNQITQTKMAQAGVAETLHRWLVSDVSSGQGYLQIENDSATDAQYTPVLEAFQGQTSGNPAFIIRAYHGSDGAANPPVIILDSRFTGDVTLATRHLFAIRNNAVDRVLFKADGGIVQTIIDPGSNPELFKFTISGNATAFFKIMDADPSSTRFGPWLFAYNDNTSAFPALHIYAQIASAGDTGTTQPIMVLDSRTASGAVATRPLLMLRNFGTEYWRSNPSGQIVQTVLSQTGVAELLHKWFVSDDTTSNLELKNASTTDAQFVPWLFSANLFASAVHPGLYLYSAVATAQDTGLVPLMIFDSRLANNAAPTSRPLFDFRSGGVSRLTMNPYGDILQTRIAVAGTAELLHKWTVSDGGGGYIQFINQLSTDGLFVPNIHTYNATGGSGTFGFRTVHYIPVLDDAGANPMYVLDLRLFNDTGVLVKPLFDIRNANVSKLLMDWNGKITQTRTAEAATAETLHKWQLSDASDFLEIGNNSATDAQFAPRIRGQFVTADTQAGLYLRSEIANTDAGSTASMFIDVRKADSTAVVTRPLLHINNAGINLIQITPQGRLNQFIQSVTGSAEILQKWTVSDDANSLIQWENTTATDAIFQPMLRMRCGSNTGGCYILSDTLPAQDTGTNAMLTLLLRRSDATAITSRSLLDVNNAGTSALLISALGKHTQTATAQAGVGEVLHQWQLTENQVSFIVMENGTATDGKLAGQLRFRHDFDNVSSCGNIVSEVNGTFDSGNSAILAIISRRIGGTPIATRPLVKFLNNNTTVGGVNANGDFFHSVIAQTGVAELLHKWTVSDDASGLIQFENASNTDAVFVPMLRMRTATTSANFILADIPSANDSGANAVLVIRTQNTVSAVIATRPLVDFQNTSANSVLKINSKGDVLQTIIAQTGVAEIIHKWTVSDDANGFIQFENGSTTDAVFRPYIHIQNTGTSQTLLIVECLAANDSGTNPMLQVDGRRSTPAALTTRPVFGISNNLTALATFGLTALTLAEAYNIVLGTTTGTKIGTATTQKLAFYNATPIVQPAANADTSGATLAQLETEVNELKAMFRSLGLMA